MEPGWVVDLSNYGSFHSTTNGGSVFVVAVGEGINDLISIDVETGETLWENEYAGEKGIVYKQPEGEQEDKVLLGCGPAVYCLNPETGDEIWAWRPENIRDDFEGFPLPKYGGDLGKEISVYTIPAEGYEYYDDYTTYAPAYTYTPGTTVGEALGGAAITGFLWGLFEGGEAERIRNETSTFVVDIETGVELVRFDAMFPDDILAYEDKIINIKENLIILYDPRKRQTFSEVTRETREIPGEVRIRGEEPFNIYRNYLTTLLSDEGTRHAFIYRIEDDYTIGKVYEFLNTLRFDIVPIEREELPGMVIATSTKLSFFNFNDLVKSWIVDVAKFKNTARYQVSFPDLLIIDKNDIKKRSLATGEIVWERNVKKKPAKINAGKGILVTPRSDNILGVFERGCFLLDSSTGDLIKWNEFNEELEKEIWVDTDDKFFYVHGKNLHCIDAMSFDDLFTLPFTDKVETVSPAGDYLIVKTGEGLICFSPVNQNIEWELSGKELDYDIELADDLRYVIVSDVENKTLTCYYL
jgi:hypothetical protein